MLTIDGSSGEGGGQILRSSLALAVITGRAFRMHHVRAGRPKPGLMRQHLTALQAAAAISGAALDGAAVGSTELVFRPGSVRPGSYAFSIGTAGSATLVLQTVLPALMLAPGESTLALEGCTQKPSSPPFRFLAEGFFPPVARLGGGGGRTARAGGRGRRRRGPSARAVVRRGARRSGGRRRGRRAPRRRCARRPSRPTRRARRNR